MSRIIKVLKTTLKGTLSTTALAMTVQKFVDSKEVELVTADFDGDFVVVLTQGTNIEIIKCTAITQNGSDDTAILTIDSAGRHINPQSPWTGGATGIQFTTGASVIVTNDPYTMSRLGNIDFAQTWALLQTFTIMPQSSDVPTVGADLINKTYADALVLGALTTVNVVVPATAGETVTAGALVYFDTTDNEWKLSDADTASTVENVMLAIAQGAGTDGNAITGGVLMRGLDNNQSGMTQGDPMYAGNTAGVISSSAGTKEVTVGIAKSATALYFNPHYNQQLTEDEQDALAGSAGTPSATNKYVTQEGLQTGSELFGADAEASDAYVITLSPAISAYTTGKKYTFTANTANTDGATLNINGVGAQAILKQNDVALVTGDIEAGQVVEVVWDGANFQMVSQVALAPSTTYTNGDTTKDATDASTTQNIAHGLSSIPKKIKITAMVGTGGASSGDSNTYLAKTVYNGTTQSSASVYYKNSAPFALMVATFTLGADTTDGSQTGVVTVDATNIIITWTKTSSPTGVYQLLWEAEV